MHTINTIRRWSLQVGVPVTYYLGSSFTDLGLTSFEFLPSLHLFSDNKDPYVFGFARPRDLEQEPLLQLEAHFSRNFGSSVWVSADALYLSGGETSQNGFFGPNDQEALMLGASIGLKLHKHVTAKASYCKTVERNLNGPDAEMLRLTVSSAF
jgi:hypothetical protein